MPRAIEQSNDFVMLAYAEKPTRHSRVFHRTFKNCRGMSDVASMVACTITEEEETIQEVVDDYQYTYTVGRIGALNNENNRKR